MRSSLYVENRQSTVDFTADCSDECFFLFELFLHVV